MATAQVLTARVRGLVDDPGYSDADILALLNEGLQEIAHDPHIFLAPIDAMATVTTVVDTNIAALPANYSQGVYAASVDGVALTVYNSWTEMARYFGDTTLEGDVQAVAVKDGKLFYLPIPETATVITIYYYRIPTVLVSGAQPDCFNVKTIQVGESALKYYVAFRMWEEIEDGIDGAKVNTAAMKSRFDEEIGKLKSITRAGTAAPKQSRNKPW